MRKEAAVKYVQALRCKECEREYPIEPEHVCSFCFGPLEVVYDYDRDPCRDLVGLDSSGSSVDLALRRAASRPG